MCTRHIVIFVVVCAILRCVDARGESRPLQPVACALGEAWVAAGICSCEGVCGVVAAANVTHATANFYGIGAYHALLRGVVREGYKALMLARLEVELAEGYPHRVTHFLVYGEGVVATRCMYSVVGIADAIFKRSVGDVESVYARCRYRSSPRCCCYICAIRGCGYHACCAIGKGVVARGVDVVEVCKAYTGMLPRRSTSGLAVYGGR